MYGLITNDHDYFKIEYFLAKNILKNYCQPKVLLQLGRDVGVIGCKSLSAAVLA